MQKNTRIVAVLGISKRVPALLEQTNTILEHRAGNPALANLQPTAAALTQAVTKVQTCQAAVGTRVAGAVANRDQAVTALVALLQQYRASVQTAADADAANAANIVQSAGLLVRRPTSAGPRIFAAKAAALSGAAKLVAPSAARRASYEWEYSVDGAKTWVTLPVTMQAKTSVTGLPVGAAVQFRYRPVTKTGEGNWSHVVTLVVQ